AVAAETDSAIEAVVWRETIQNWMVVRRIIVDTGPTAAWHGTSQHGQTFTRHCAKIADLLLAQPLCIVVGIACRKHVRGRTDERYTANIRAQVDIAGKVERDGVHPLPTTKIVGTTQ